MARRTWIENLERPLALVFGGGASLGASQVGMARALIEYGIEPDLMVGTSVGALNGSFLAREFSHSAVDELEEIWKSITRESVFPGIGFVRTLRMFTSRGLHLASKSGLRRLVETHLPERHRDLDVPTVVMASDLESGAKVSLEAGDLRHNVVTSASIPLVFEPEQRDGTTLVDGGVTSNVPVLPARLQGAESMIVLDPGYPCGIDHFPTDLIGFTMHLITLMLRQQAYGVLHFLSEQSQIVYIPPPCPIEVAPHQFHRTEKLIERGYEQAHGFLDDIEVDGSGVFGHPHFHGDLPEAAPEMDWFVQNRDRW